MLLDVLLAIVIIAGFINGFRRGLIYSIFAFAALFFGVMLGMKYSFMLTAYLHRWNIFQTRFLPFISFVAILLIVLTAVKMCYKLVQSISDKLFLGTVNKIIGGALWAIILVLIYSTLLWFSDKLHLISEEMKAASLTYQYAVAFAPLAAEEFSRVIPWFRGIFESLEKFFRDAPFEDASKGTEV